MIFSIFVSLFIVLSAMGYGGLFLDLAGRKNKLFALGAGCWCLSSVVYLLGLAGQLKTPFMWGLLFSGAAVGLILFFIKQRSSSRNLTSATFSSPGIWFFCLGLLVVVPAILALAGTLTPPVERDSLVYHLALPKLYLESGQWSAIPHNIYSYFPGLTESLYTLVLGLGSRYPALIHFIFGLACLAATYELGRLLGLRREIRLLCIAGLLVTPTFFLEMIWAYVDLAMVFYWLLAIIAFFYWLDERKHIWLVFLGIFMGGALSCKYTGLLLFLVIPLGILFELRGEKDLSLRQIFSSLAIPLLIGALVSSPWWLRNMLLTNNPFFPFLWGVFPTQSTEWDGSRAGLFSVMLEGYGGAYKGLPDYFLAPFRVFLQARMNDPGLYDGQLGFYYLLGLPILVYFKKLPRKIFYLLGLIIFYFAYWTVTSQQVRFLLVALPVLSLFVGFLLQMFFNSLADKKTGASTRQGVAVFQIVFVGIVLWALAANLANTFMVFRNENYLDVFLAKVSEQEYLQQKLEYYEIYTYINSNLPDDAYLFLVMTGNQGYYLNRRFFSDSVFEAETMKKIFSEAETAEEIALKLKERKWTHLLLRRDYFTRELGAFLLPEKEKRLQDFFDKHLEVLKHSGQFWLFKIL